MQILTITGNCGRDPEHRTTQGGDEVCSFSVGVKQGWGERASTNWFRCSVWGKRARTIADHLRKGTKVTVVGELSIGEYEGKPQYDIRVSEMDWTPTGQREPDGSRGAAPQRGGYDDLDDSVPFLSCDPALEYRAR
jgi:single-strand DNA-binding protein